MVEDLAHGDLSGDPRNFGAVSGLKVGPGLASLIGDEQLQSVIDHFVRLLEFTPSELQRCGADTDGHLVPRIRAATSPVAIFIDGVDEVLQQHHVEGPTSIPASPASYLPTYGTSRNLVWWRFLISFADQPYIKVFAAVRKEAYARLAKTTVMAQQYRGSAIDIAYSRQSLREIFLNKLHWYAC